MMAWLLAFAFTQIVEVPIYLRALDTVQGRGPQRSTPRAVLLAFGASALTHPLVWFAFPRLLAIPYWSMVGWAEVFAVVAEAIYFRALGVKRAFWWSLGANAASAGLALECRHFFGWP